MEWKCGVPLKGRICSIRAVGISSYEVCFESKDAASCIYVFDVDDRDGIAVVVRPGNFLDTTDPGDAASRQVMEAILVFHSARQHALEFRRSG